MPSRDGLGALPEHSTSVPAHLDTLRSRPSRLPPALVLSPAPAVTPHPVGRPAAGPARQRPGSPGESGGSPL